VKFPVRIALAVTGALSVISLSASLMLLRGLLSQGDTAPGSARFHLALFVPRDGGSFFETLAEGALQAAAENDAALSIHYLGPDSLSLEFASLLGADGIAVCPGGSEVEERVGLESISAAGLPLVLINRSVPSDLPRPFVGVNNYDWGKRAGSFVESSLRRPGTLAVIYSDKAPSVLAERELFEMGLNQALGEGRASRLGGSAETPIASWKTGLNPQDAEHIVYEIVHGTPDLSGVIFTDEHDTVAGCQALIDLNLVGRISIVGAGSQKAIEDYVRKGIMAGSVVVDPSVIGQTAINSLVELCATGYTSNSVDTGISVIERETLARSRVARTRK